MRGQALALHFRMEIVSHFHCKCFLGGCQDYAPILPFPATWLVISLRALPCAVCTMFRSWSMMRTGT